MYPQVIPVLSYLYLWHTLHYSKNLTKILLYYSCNLDRQDSCNLYNFYCALLFLHLFFVSIWLVISSYSLHTKRLRQVLRWKIQRDCYLPFRNLIQSSQQPLHITTGSSTSDSDRAAEWETTQYSSVSDVVWHCQWNEIEKIKIESVFKVLTDGWVFSNLGTHMEIRMQFYCFQWIWKTHKGVQVY